MVLPTLLCYRLDSSFPAQMLTYQFDDKYLRDDSGTIFTKVLQMISTRLVYVQHTFFSTFFSFFILRFFWFASYREREEGGGKKTKLSRPSSVQFCFGRTKQDLFSEIRSQLFFFSHFCFSSRQKKKRNARETWHVVGKRLAT